MEFIYILLILLFVILVALCIKGLCGSKSAAKVGGDEKPHVKVRSVYKPREENPKVQKELLIPNALTYDQETVDAIVKYINEYPTFGPLGAEEMKHLEAGAKKLKVPIANLLQFRDVVVTQRVANSKFTANMERDSIQSAHAAGKTILEIAQEKKLSPMAVARQILLKDAEGADEDEKMKRVTELINDPSSLDKKLAAEVKEAASADHCSAENMDKVRAAGTDFEKSVAKYMKKEGIKFMNEEEIRADQIKIYGKPISTPDFAFEDPIKINGKLVNWMAVKNYPLFTSKHMLNENSLQPRLNSQLARQAINYNKNFRGAGAFVFSGGVTEGLEIATMSKDQPARAVENVVIVDGSSIA